ncbi:MAG: hypothetical protein HQK87_09145 [Nitrospinae bacterium]|nr:hypothetical protein [Nitrospinota bacterium]
MEKSLIALCAAACFIFLPACGGGGGSTTTEPTPTPTPTPQMDPTPYAGVWTGSWRNLTFGTTGGASMEITVDTATKSMTQTIGFDGKVFGGSTPPTVTITGTYDQTATLSAIGTPLGDIAATIDGNGAITITMTNDPTGAIASVALAGTVAATAIDMTYDVTYNNGAKANGTISLTL